MPSRSALFARPPSRMNTSVPVIVFSCVVPNQGVSRAYGALGVARSLGRLGVPIYMVGDKGLWPISFSRYWKKVFPWDLSAPLEESLHFLRDVACTVGGRPILLAATDRTAVFVAKNSAALEENFIFPKVAPELLRRLTNKSEMALTAKANGIPAPETSFPQSRQDVEKFLQDARFPVMLKGANPLLPFGTIKEIIGDAKQLFARIDEAAAGGPPNLILQEYIPGGDGSVWMCNGYFNHDSDCLATFTGKKLRQWPPHAGVASLSEYEPNETVEATTRRFLEAVGYQGLVGIGYRYDARDGLYKVLDVNPRLSGVFRLFVAADGMDMARVAYLSLTHQSVPPITIPAGRKWMMEEDFISAFQYARQGKLTFKQWRESLRGVKEWLWLSRDDVMPFVVWCWRRLGNAAERIFARKPRVQSNPAPLKRFDKLSQSKVG
jgi:D-aspartate ligase